MCESASEIYLLSSAGEKIDCHDSGTESDGDFDTEDFHDRDIELSMSSQNGTTSPECSADSPTFLSPSSNLLFDQHSSEEELEVIMTNPLDALVEISYSNENSDQNKKPKINQHGEKLPKRCSSSSTFLEKRKRSLAHNSDDEVRQFLESQPYHHHNIPVNFRTSPPLEALKPNRGHLVVNNTHLNCNDSHQQRSTTPLILVEAGRRGIENIRISCESPLTSASSTASSSSLDHLRSISPPTKVFAVSPRHRTPRSNQLHRQQRRPCLNFDKMMQVSNRMISSPGV